MPDGDAQPGVGIERFEFADGTVWSREEMLALAMTQENDRMGSGMDTNWIRDLWDQQHREELARPWWGSAMQGAAPPPLEPSQITPQQARFNAQVDQMVQAMAAFAPPAAMVSTAAEQQAAWAAPVWAVAPF
ncbi:calcium-binding protein [Hydrogenophaga sp. T2]|uniref:calcium-binding protein n=1 Tax=Hydrogenophaga sp. T2 TaxID=3132823 RepID=UPI003CE8A152